MSQSRRPVRVFHTSDWHLGRTLCEMPRDDEFDAFLQWMLERIEQESIDVLLISGDIFDTSNPPYAAQQRYYEFCTRLSRTCCKHAVITSGNHDSTLFIDVPSHILSCLNIHVIGQPRFGIGKSGVPADEVVVLRDDDGQDMMIVAAVPFLSDMDLRFSTAGEGAEDKQMKMREGMRAHYRLVAEAAEQVRAGRDIPVVGMGHLYVSDSIVVEGDGVRPTYVGNLGGVNASIFGPSFDYVALGHLHVPQPVGGCDHIRYSGSPLAMGFGEAGQQKSICKIVFNGRSKEISLYPVKCFRELARIIGNEAEIESQLRKYIENGTEVYVSVTYTGSDSIDVRGLVQEIIGECDYVHCLDTPLNCVQKADYEGAELAGHVQMTLQDLDEKMVFEQLLDAKCPGLSDEKRASLMDTFNELVLLVQSE